MATEKYDAILLLGGRINLDGSLPEAAKLQVQKAVELYNIHSPRAIIACGFHNYKSDTIPEISEAKAYSRYLEKLGVRHENIYLEERSLDTVGNILFAKTDILMPHNWSRIVILPTKSHLTERVSYIARKVLGLSYTWTIVRGSENLDESNVAKEKKALELTKEINDPFKDGDHDAIYAGLLATHPAYGAEERTTEKL